MAYETHRCKHKSFVTYELNAWILDSGTTDHMTVQKRTFITFTKKSSSIEKAGGSKLKAEKYDDVQIELSSECGGKHVTLANTLYLPGVNENLISAIHLIGSEHSIKLTERGAQINKRYEGIKGFAPKKKNILYRRQEHTAYKIIRNDIAR